MELAKLNITPLDPSGEPTRDSIPVLFNPNSYSIIKPVTWRPPDLDPGSAPSTYRDLDVR